MPPWSPTEALEVSEYSDEGNLRHWIPHILLFALKFCLSAAVDTGQLHARLKTSPGGIFLGVCTQFVCLPICGAATCYVLDLPVEVGVALILVTNSPGGSFSNWWCSVFNADLAMSVAMTAISTIAGLVILPFNLFIYSHIVYGDDYLSEAEYWVIVEVIVVVLVALGCGLFTSWLIKRYNDNPYPPVRSLFILLGSTFGLLLLVYSIIVSSFTDAHTTTLWQKPFKIYLAVFIPLLLGLLTVVPFSKNPRLHLEPPQRVAVVVEALYQNIALAQAAALMMFKGAHRANAVSIPILYGGAEMLVLGVFCLVAHYAHWTLVNPKEDTLWTAITRNFQERADPKLMADDSASKGYGTRG